MLTTRLVVNCVLAGTLVIAGAACYKDASPCPQYTLAAATPTAIFNPSDSPAPLVNFDRADWPVAYVSEPTAEVIQFREQFIDIHERGFGWADGYVFRRFESNRWGRSRR